MTLKLMFTDLWKGYEPRICCTYVSFFLELVVLTSFSVSEYFQRTPLYLYTTPSSDVSYVRTFDDEAKGNRKKIFRYKNRSRLGKSSNTHRFKDGNFERTLPGRIMYFYQDFIMQNDAVRPYNVAPALSGDERLAELRIIALNIQDECPVRQIVG